MRCVSFLLIASICLGASFPNASDQQITRLTSQPETKNDPEKKDDAKKPSVQTIDPLDDEMLRRAKISTAGDELLAFFKKRILPESDRPEVERLIQRLGSSNYRARETALRDLVHRGVPALEILRAARAAPSDVEQGRRVDQVIRLIYDKDVGPAIAAAAVRVASFRSPKGLADTLIGYVPFADNETLLEEIRVALTQHALVDGKADPSLVAALTDRSPLRRAIAGECLGRTVAAEHKEALKKLLHDPVPLVRFRTARVLALARDRDAIPVLIDSIPDLPLNTAWQVEDFLLKLTDKTPPAESMGNSAEARAKCKDAWRAWWKTHGAKADLARLSDPPSLLGRTLIVLLDENSVLELGPDNQPRWQINNLGMPLDAQLIGDDHLLTAEHRTNRVIERNTRGEVVWQKGVIGPLAAQRLANGNTFIATDHQLLEYDKSGAETVNISFPEEGRKIMKAMKLANGEIVCMLADARIVRFDARGNEVGAFPINLGQRLYGGRIYMLENGRVLVPHNSDNKVVEYDAKGKAIWEVHFDQPIAAVRLPNGNTMITSMSPDVGAVEVDRTGATVWSYQHSTRTRVTRAIRR